MYNVIQMHGDCEPWWFLEGWEADIISNKEFKHYEEALSYYQKEWVYLSETYPERESHKGVMTAFWNPTERLWCEECDEYLQQFHSIMLVESTKDLPTGLRATPPVRRPRPCRIRKNTK